MTSNPPEKIVICISGMAGSGKSTAARKIARKYNLRYFSGGDALKSLALEMGFAPRKRGWWESAEGMKFLTKRMEDPSFDRKIDERLLTWATEGNVVLDSWTMPWLFNRGFKIWLEASKEERARRISKRDNTSFEQALSALQKKEATTKIIYKKLYGFNLGEDFSPFDLVLDVNYLRPEGVFNTLCLVLDSALKINAHPAHQ
ncbi:MAG: cytidylate kinase family protein [Candidatus Bathyarchaeota archaeon]|nr:cytidylate kinase family protein [Candidatus Bathyarchaeota archaeon]